MKAIQKAWVENQRLNSLDKDPRPARALSRGRRIAVEGLEREIISIVCEILEKFSYDICYRHESLYRRIDGLVFELLENPSDIVQNILESRPNLTIVCNARGYLSFLEQYSKSTNIPLLVLTGGGPELIKEVGRHTPNILEVPFRMQYLYYTIEEILKLKTWYRLRKCPGA
jgi:hypothetical protein